MIEKLIRNIRFKRTRSYDLKDIGSSVFTKLNNEEAFTLLEFKQLILALQHITTLYDRVLTPIIFNVIFDCYILSCHRKPKTTNYYYYSKSDTDIKFSKKNITLKEIAAKTKMKHQKNIIDNYIDVGEWAVRGPLVWLRDEIITKQSLNKFNENRLIRNDLLVEFTKHLERRKEYATENIDRTVKDYVSGFYVYDIQRYA